jgi:hypothetical protein
MRLNGVAQTLTYVGGNAGSGNFGSFPLYVGRRNNASNPLNGRLYQLIIRGAASTAGQVSSTEQYIAGKMQITIP